MPEPTQSVPPINPAVKLKHVNSNQRNKETFERRFFEKVLIPADRSQCWKWNGAISRRGYGFFKIGPTNKGAHRISWSIVNGEIPKGMVICHTCDNPSCVNPSHLFIGTQSDNMQDCIRKGRWGNVSVPKKIRGGEASHTTLKNSQVLQIRADCLSGESQRSVAEKFNVSKSAVNHIVARRSWRHI